MPKQSLDYCAMHYLNQWYSQDRKYVEMLNGHSGQYSPEQKRGLLRDAAIFYKVARNVPGDDKTDRKRWRYQSILDELMRSSSTNFEDDTVRKIVGVQNRLCTAIGSGKEVMSLTTKMLWLKHQDHIVIFDSMARKGLDKPDAELEEFYEEWRIQYEHKSGKIYDACQRLPSKHSHVYNAGYTSRADIEDVIQYQWFHERVFDMYLWFKGEALG